MYRCYSHHQAISQPNKEFQYSKCIGVMWMKQVFILRNCYFNTPNVSVLLTYYVDAKNGDDYFNTPNVSVLSKNKAQFIMGLPEFQYSKCIGVIFYTRDLKIAEGVFQYSKCIGVIDIDFTFKHLAQTFQYSKCIGVIKNVKYLKYIAILFQYSKCIGVII